MKIEKLCGKDAASADSKVISSFSQEKLGKHKLHGCNHGNKVLKFWRIFCSANLKMSHGLEIANAISSKLH